MSELLPSRNLDLMRRPRRILLLVPGDPLPVRTYGGVERIAQAVIERLCAEGHEVHVISHPDTTGPFDAIPWPCEERDQDGRRKFVAETAARLGVDVVHDFCLPCVSDRVSRSVPVVISLPSHPGRRNMRRYLLRSPGTVFCGCALHIAAEVPWPLSHRTIYNAIDMRLYSATPTVPADAPLVFLGRIDPVKGADAAIDIAQKAGRRLVLAGNVTPGNQSYFDERIVPRLNADITFIGPVDDAGKQRLFAGAAAFINPLQWHEPFGLTVVESMACGTPVIALPYGSMVELIRDGVNGFIARDADDAVTLIGTRLNEIDRMACRRSVETRFDLPAMTDRYLDLYDELLSAPNERRK